VRSGLTKAYRDLTAYAVTHPKDKVPVEEATYVATYLSNYAAVYQIRSAQALGAIGGPDARPALEAALKQPLRADVHAAVKAALTALDR
jgi:PBS lyase HEAT-like repeat-containing protein